MEGLSVEQNLNKAKSLVRKGKELEALDLYDSIIKKFPHNKRAQLGIQQLKPLNIQKLDPSPQKINTLIEHYQTGRYAEAETLAQLITEEFPEHPFGWKVLGAVLKETGRISESIVPFQKSLEITPQDPVAHSNLGITLQALGRLEEAETILRQSIALKFDYATAHNNLGITLQGLGKLEEAEISLKQAIALKSDFFEAYVNLGNTLKELNKLDESVSYLNQGISIKPDFPEAHNNLGNTLKKLGKLEEAEASYTKSILLKPNYVEAYNNLGVILKDLGRLSESEANLKHVIALKPNNAEAYNNLGNTLQEMGKLEEAMDSYEYAISLESNNFEAYNNLGVTFHDLDKLQEAEKSFRQAIIIKPDYAESHNNLGNLLKDLGQLEQAESSFKEAIKFNPYNTSAYRHIALINRIDLQDDVYLKMKSLYNNKSISGDQLCHINFGLGKIYGDAELFEKSFKHYEEGNLLRKKILNYDFHQDTNLFKKLKISYPILEQNSLNFDNHSSILTPIFILGMPRSGTTLVEQIISSHSKVKGAGELRHLSNLGSEIASGLCEVNKASLINFRNRYLAKLQDVSEGKMIVTDKMPHNFLYIGLISAVFPDAKIIHVRRNPSALCWGNYKQYFNSKNLGYCYGIEDIINYYGLYKNLMEFWKKNLNQRIYNIDYDLLTIKQEDETRKMLDYIGLNWEDACMSPEQNTRSVATASSIQVRKKVYKGSSEKWKLYKPYLAGAFDCLE